MVGYFEYLDVKFYIVSQKDVMGTKKFIRGYKLFIEDYVSPENR